MKVVILAGGIGSRLSEETLVRPKPMVEIGGKPILWHIMKIYSAHGINDFIVCLGYKGYMIKEYFANYFLHTSDITLHLADNRVDVHQRKAEPWRITLVDTGDSTMTGGRLKHVRPYLGDGTFCMTYGDGVSNINITDLVAYHQSHGKLATVTAVQNPGRFGSLVLEEASVVDFVEKPIGGGGWISGGFFVLNPKVIDLIDDASTVWEQAPLRQLASNGQLQAFQLSNGFWHPMDTLRDRSYLEDLWNSGRAPWKIWT